MRILFLSLLSLLLAGCSSSSHQPTAKEAESVIKQRVIAGIDGGNESEQQKAELKKVVEGMSVLSVTNCENLTETTVRCHIDSEMHKQDGSTQAISGPQVFSKQNGKWVTVGPAE